MADFLRIVMLALILAVAPQIVYLFDPGLVRDLGPMVIPWPLASLNLFVDAVWAGVGWWLYVIWRRYR
jgi:hypothetical protein